MPEFFLKDHFFFKISYILLLSDVKEVHKLFITFSKVYFFILNIYLYIICVLRSTINSKNWKELFGHEYTWLQVCSNQFEDNSKHVEDKLNPLSWKKTGKNYQVTESFEFFLFIDNYYNFFFLAIYLRADFFMLFFSIDEQNLNFAFQIHTMSGLFIYFRYETPVITFICHFSTTANSDN